MKDISPAKEIKALRHRVALLESLLRHDVLTGCYNRRKFEEDYRKLVYKSARYQTHYYLILIDLDEFKKINDTYGHDAGDKALKKFVEVTEDCIRVSDRLYRMGGDEFIIVLRTPDRDACIEKMSEIQEKLGDLKISYGGVLISDAPVEAALKVADELMYQNKRRNKC